MPVGVRSEPSTGIPDRLLGRPFGSEALERIRQLIGQCVPRLRAEIARRVCEHLGWVGPGGRPALMSARVALLRLQERGLIELPPPSCGNGNGRGGTARPLQALTQTAALEGSVDHMEPLTLRAVSDRQQSGLWNGLVARHHYLGHHNLPGAQVRYLVYARGHLVSAIGFGAAAWHIAVRDAFIGWTRPQRERHLHRVLNNARFVILPWVRLTNLASKILGLCARQLPEDFQKRYGWTPVLLETFVELSRFRATCYRAANWICLGSTQGRGKKGPHNPPGKTGVPIKAVWVYPLDRQFRRHLAPPPLP